MQILRRLAPHLLDAANRRSYPVNLVMFALINLGVFSKYAEIFYSDPTLIAEACLVCIVLSVIYAVAGILVFRLSSVEDRLAGAVMIAHMNNVLMIVFSAQFFGPRETMTAAMYLLPFSASSCRCVFTGIGSRNDRSCDSGRVFRAKMRWDTRVSDPVFRDSPPRRLWRRWCRRRSGGRNRRP